MGAPGKESLFSKENFQIATAGLLLIGACSMGVFLQEGRPVPNGPSNTPPLAESTNGCVTVEPGMTAGQIFISSGAQFGPGTELSIHLVGDGHPGTTERYRLTDAAALNAIGTVIFEGDVICVDE